MFVILQGSRIYSARADARPAPTILDNISTGKGVEKNEITGIYGTYTEQIKNKVVSNELKTGELLPSIRTLAKDLRISVITTKNAYDELEKEGFVETVPGKGTYVANKNVELIKEEQLAKIQDLLDTAVQLAKLSKISEQEVKNMLDILFMEE